MTPTVTGLAGVELEGESFKGMNLREADLRGSTFTRCDFDDADMSYADCTRARFPGCTFRQSILYKTNFTDAKLGATVFEPKDCYGMTVTLECQTFMNMKVSPLWWYCWLIFGTQMLPDATVTRGGMRDSLIALIGAERYVKLRAMFERRSV